MSQNIQRVLEIDSGSIGQTVVYAVASLDNGDIWLNPHGTGAVRADNAGDARGDYSTDFQRVRTSESQVASGDYSTILGGVGCTAAGLYSVAAGRRANAGAAGSFVFADATDAEFTVTTANQVAFRASGGLRFVDGNQAANKVLTCDADGVGTWQAVPIGLTAVVEDTSPQLGGHLNAGVFSIDLVNTTSATTGVITKEGDRFIHNFQHPTGNTATPDGQNTFVGVNAGNFTMGSGATETYHGSYNVAIGDQALLYNITGFANTAAGRQTLYSNTTGSDNAAVGDRALYSNTEGSQNTGIGHQTLLYNTTGYQNTAIGRQALYSNISGNNNIAVGRMALFSNTEGEDNAAVGDRALYFNTTGLRNTAIGGQALYNNISGDNNVSFGRAALFSNTTGYRNIGLGRAALRSNTTGYQNIAIGDLAGFYLADGSSGNETADNAIYLGAGTRASTAGRTNEIVIGSGAIGEGSNTMRLGSTSLTLVRTSGVLRAGGYRSSDNSLGATQNVTVDGTTLVYKNGLFVGTL